MGSRAMNSFPDWHDRLGRQPSAFLGHRWRDQVLARQCFPNGSTDVRAAAPRGCETNRYDLFAVFPTEWCARFPCLHARWLDKSTLHSATSSLRFDTLASLIRQTAQGAPTRSSAITIFRAGASYM